MMKKLSDFKDEKGIEIASEVLSVIMEMLADERNRKQEGEKNKFKMFTAFMRNTPDKMKEIFAILSEEDIKDYHCDGAEAMANMMILSNDPIILGLFTSQSQTGDAKSSGSASVNTTESEM